MKCNGSEILVRVLLENGVDTIFGYPGGAVLDIYDALYRFRDKIHHYMTVHEQGAAHAADGYARATGKTGVVLATSGPGATNLVTGIATAYMDSVPLVAITGNVPNKLIGRDSFQEVYIAGITMPITKHNFVVRRVEDLADTLRSAFRIAASGRPGPVLVDIPKDIGVAVTDYEPAPPVTPDKPSYLNLEDLPEIAEAVNTARKPVLFIGGGAKSPEAVSLIKEIIAKTGIPAVHTIMATGVLPRDLPENLGIVGMHGSVKANRAVDHADVLLAVGTRFSDRVALNTDKFAGKARIIQIDIDRSEINKNVQTDLSVVGDAVTVLSSLKSMLKPLSLDEWYAKIAGYEQPVAEKTGGGTLHPREIMDALGEAAAPGSIFVTDVGQHQMWAAQYLDPGAPEDFLTSGGLGTMGYGYGAAIGAAVGTGKTPVFHITGDGSFHMNMNEACTAVTYKVPVISVILNNSALGMVRQWQTVFYGRRYSSSEPERVTDYVKVAEGFGAKGYSCSTPEQLRVALREAVNAGGPVWIECVVDREERVLPMIPAGGTVENCICD